MIQLRAICALCLFLAASSVGAAAAKQDGNILYVSIPPDVSAADVAFGGSSIAERVNGHIRTHMPPRRVPGVSQSQEPGLDLIVVLLDHDGEPILPERKALQPRGAKKTSDTAITFTYNSPGFPWSA